MKPLIFTDDRIPNLYIKWFGELELYLYHKNGNTPEVLTFLVKPKNKQQAIKLMSEYVDSMTNDID